MKIKGRITQSEVQAAVRGGLKAGASSVTVELIRDDKTVMKITARTGNLKALKGDAENPSDCNEWDRLYGRDQAEAR